MRIAPTFCNRVAPPSGRRWISGIASLDATLAGGLAHGCVHEVYAGEVGDAAASAGFAMALTAGMAGRDQAAMWLRSRRSQGAAGVIQASGWAELGGVPGLGLLAVLPDTLALLRAAVDALRSPALGAVIVEGWGAMRELDLTASRRLALAAEKSGVPLFLLRIDAEPVPSAAQTRWQVTAAPSLALPGNAPGMPTFDVTLLRQRSGPCGLSWRLEWDRDRHLFRDAALSGAVVSPPASRTAEDTGGKERRAA
ncbi:MAG: ImuA family protein [Novosphingobium sp.]